MLIRNSREGIHIDRIKLRRDLSVYEKALKLTDTRIHKVCGRKFSIDSAEELADAMDAAGLSGKYVLTKTGKRSVSKINIGAAIKDPTLLSLLNYRGRLETALSTFMRNWHRVSEETGLSPRR